MDGGDESTELLSLVAGGPLHGGKDCLGANEDFMPEGDTWAFAHAQFSADGEDYEVKTNSAGGGMDTKVIVLDSSCECIAYGDGDASGGRASTVTFSTSGSTHLIISSLNEIVGDYTVEFKQP